MRVCAIALAAALTFSGAALAEEATTGTTTTGPAAMSDAEMDRVTAGQPNLIIHGLGPDKNNQVFIGGANPPPALESVPDAAFSGLAPQSAKPGP